MNAFVGDTTTFTCQSEVQRWLKPIKSSLSYKFQVNADSGHQVNNTLWVPYLNFSHQDINVSCSASDDLGLESDASNVITVDPNCTYTLRIHFGPSPVLIYFVELIQHCSYFRNV